MAARGTMTESSFAIDALRRCALFAKVDDDTLDLCASTLRIRRYRKHETIFHQGDPGDSLYIIESGSVKIVLPSPGGEEGAIIATLGRGDFFGELALLDGAPDSATAVAIEPTESLVLRRDRFDELVENEPQLRRALFSALVTELRRLTGHVEELHFLDLPGRLASRIVRLARESQPVCHDRHPAGLAVHPERPRRDDRRDPPDGQSAAGRHDRPGPRPAGARRP